jgi:hypothetical protein
MKSVITILLVLFLTARSAADVTDFRVWYPCTEGVPCHLRFTETTRIVKDNQDTFYLPPGRYLREDTFKILDDEMKKLQDSETRLKAENESFRKSLDGWQPGFITVTVAVVLGIATGIGGYYWYENRD